MKDLIKKLLNESLILFENRLYGNNIVKMITNRIKDDSNDTINKIAIAGLYRNVFGDIQQLNSKEELKTVFNKWFEDTIKNLIKTPSFIDNEELAKKYLDGYVNNIKSLGDKAQPFSLKKVEETLVDLVNNNKWIDDNTIKRGNNIYNPKDEDIVYEDNNIMILDTNTKAKCVMYGQGESWCITKPELNYYNTYRINYGATPYFVLQKNIGKPKHKIVIMHYKSGYGIADQTNSGEMAGGNSQNNHPWSWVESELPNLKGLEKYFTYRPVSNDEMKYEEILNKTKAYIDDNLQGYIDNAIKDLILNGSKVQAPDFIRDYAALGKNIKDNQIKSLRPEVIDSLIESGYFITVGKNQSHLLNDKQQLRVIRIKIQNNISLTDKEFLVLPEDTRINYINKLNSYGISYLLSNSKEPDKIINILGQKGIDYINSLDSFGIDNLLNSSKEPDKIINILSQKGIDYINKLNSYGIGNLLEYSKEPDKIINILLSTEGFINNLDSYGIGNLLKYSKEPDKIKAILTKYGKI